MAQQGATLQNYNNELVKCIEDLREKREEVNRQMLKEEEEKAKIQKDLTVLTDRLSKINEALARKTQARNEYDRTIQETEAAYMKVRRVTDRKEELVLERLTNVVNGRFLRARRRCCTCSSARRCSSPRRSRRRPERALT